MWSFPFLIEDDNKLRKDDPHKEIKIKNTKKYDQIIKKKKMCSRDGCLLYTSLENFPS